MTSVDGASLPDEVIRLFWDTDPATVDLDAHSDYVLERAMARGGWVVMCWLRERYAPTVLRDFLERRGRRLPPRELAYWAFITGAAIEVPSGGGRPSWAGP